MHKRVCVRVCVCAIVTALIPYVCSMTTMYILFSHIFVSNSMLNFTRSFFFLPTLPCSYFYLNSGHVFDLHHRVEEWIDLKCKSWNLWSQNQMWCIVTLIENVIRMMLHIFDMRTPTVSADTSHRLLVSTHPQTLLTPIVVCRVCAHHSLTLPPHLFRSVALSLSTSSSSHRTPEWRQWMLQPTVPTTRLLITQTSTSK